MFQDYSITPSVVAKTCGSWTVNCLLPNSNFVDKIKYSKQEGDISRDVIQVNDNYEKRIQCLINSE